MMLLLRLRSRNRETTLSKAKGGRSPLQVENPARSSDDPELARGTHTVVDKNGGLLRPVSRATVAP